MQDYGTKVKWKGFYLYRKNRRWQTDVKEVDAFNIVSAALYIKHQVPSDAIVYHIELSQ